MAEKILGGLISVVFCVLMCVGLCKNDLNGIVFAGFFYIGSIIELCHTDN